MPLLQQHPHLQIDHTAAGAGPPVVLVHSSAAGNRQWRKLSEALSARNHRVIAPNLRGYGATTPWTAPRDQTLADAAEVVLALCGRLEGPLMLVGHSWGGAVALWAAQALGARVSHLVLYEPMLVGLLHAHAWCEAAAEVDALHADVRRFGAAGAWQALGERFSDYFNGDGSWAASPPERRAAIAAALPPNVQEWEASAQPLHANALAGVRARCLLLCGERTRPALRAMCTLLARLHPHWTLQELAAAGHMGPLTHAEAFNRRVVDFLTDPSAVAAVRDDAISAVAA